jgi:hypothetical protein
MDQASLQQIYQTAVAFSALTASGIERQPEMPQYFSEWQDLLALIQQHRSRSGGGVNIQ